MLRTLKRAICCRVLTLAASSWDQAKPDSKDTIWLGMELSLGMPRDKVMSTLAQSYNLGRIGVDGDAWMVHDKSDQTNVLGEVEFDNSTLALVERDWTPPMSPSSLLLQLSMRPWSSL